MTEQAELFQTQPVIAPLYERGETIQQRFEKFHAANRWVYEALVKMTAAYHARGRQHIGIGHLVEVIRFEYFRKTVSDDEFRVNNDFRSRYVRLLIRDYPQYATMFETRRLRSE